MGKFIPLPTSAISKKPEFLTELQWEDLAGAWQLSFFTEQEPEKMYMPHPHPLRAFEQGLQYGYKLGSDPEFRAKELEAWGRR